MHWIIRESSVSKSIIALYLIEMHSFAVLTVGSFVPCLYYGFYCEPVLQGCYLGIIALVGAGRYYPLTSVVLCMLFTGARFQGRHILF